MYQLIYISKSVLYFSRQELDTLVIRAKNKNQHLNVTGMLVYIDGEFMQLLEGNKNVVEHLMDDIVQDDRHYGIKVIEEESTTERQFSNWNMASQIISKSYLKYFLPSEKMAQPLSLMSIFNQSSHQRLAKNLFLGVRDNLLLSKPQRL